MTVGTEVIEPKTEVQTVEEGRTRKGWINWIFVAPAILFQFFWGWYPSIVGNLSQPDQCTYSLVRSLFEGLKIMYV